MAPEQKIRFDRFELDLADERLSGPAGPVRIGNKAFRLLCALIERQGKLLTKDALFETVWDGTIVSESALTSVIKELRRALGDESRNPRFIESVYGRGYRLIPEAIPADEVPLEPAPGPTPLKLPDKPSLAVLPFTELGDTQEDWFSDGIVEEIVVALSRFPTLFVIAATSSLLYRFKPSDPATVSRELGVRYIVEGNVLRSGTRVRIIARLIDGRTGERIWTDHFDDRMDDLFALYDRVALAIAGRIDSSISDAEIERVVSRPTQSAGAAELFWRANAKLRAMTPDNLAEAIMLTEQVLEIEPENGWAASFASLCHGLSINLKWTADPEASRAKALAYYELAMRNSGEDERVYGFCGAALISAGGDMQIATRLIDRAIELNPGSATALFWGGWADAITGRPERGLERLSQSLRLNPISLIRPLMLIPTGICLLTLRRFEEAAQVLAESVQMAPGGGGLAPLAVALALAGRLHEAHAAHEQLEAAGGSLAGLELLQRPEDQALVAEGLAAAASAKAAA